MKMMKGFPEKVVKVWNEWEIRAMVLSSLCLQIILILFGSRRKQSKSFWMGKLVWLAYISADWVATVALGSMVRSQDVIILQNDHVSKPGNKTLAFWVPFLLLHLGGPDTITAYSLEDNELWSRHFLSLVVQVGIAFYVFAKSWTATSLNFISIPVFVTGIIKYGERTCVLKSSSSKQFRDSLLTYHEVSYVLLKEEETNKEVLQKKIEEEKMIKHEKVDSTSNYLCQADFLFKRCIYLFADLILDAYEREESYSMIHNKSPVEVFKLIEVELGFMFDILYTKAIIIYSRIGIPLRFLCFLSTLSALITFYIYADKHEFLKPDIYITYVLLIGAIVLEVYAFIMLLISDWTMLCFSKLKHSYSFPSPFSQSPMINRKRWSRSVAQHNLIESIPNSMLFGENSNCKRLRWKNVNEDLQVVIFRQLLQKAKRISHYDYDIKLCKQFLTERGDSVLKRKNCIDKLKWSIIDVEFDHSILLWHIATHLCQYDDGYQKYGLPKDDLYKKRKISVNISNYMMYLLVDRPTMLPKGIGEIRYRDTCMDLKKFLKAKFEESESDSDGKRKMSGDYLNKDAVSKFLMEVEIDVTRKDEEKGWDYNKSVLFDGCKLARQLQSLEREDGWSKEEKWEMISHVWVEMLAYAGSHCGWREHGQQLSNGGELLTHVSLIMAHLGLSEQYQLQKQYIKRMEMPSWIKHTVLSPIYCICCGICCGLTCLCIPIFILQKNMRRRQ